MVKRRQKLPDSLPYVPTFDTVCSRLSLPIEAKETLADAVRLAMESLMPFEEEAYTYSYEVVREQPEALDVFVAGAANEKLAQCGHDALRAVGAWARCGWIFRRWGGRVALWRTGRRWARGFAPCWCARPKRLSSSCWPMAHRWRCAGSRRRRRMRCWPTR